MFFPIFVLFSFFPDFSSKISLQPFKIETSDLVYWFTMTSCEVGLEIDILLFVLPCIFLSPYIFRQPGHVAQSVGHLTRKSGVLGSIPGLATYFRFSFRFFKKGSCQLLAKVCAGSTG